MTPNTQGKGPREQTWQEDRQERTEVHHRVACHRAEIVALVFLAELLQGKGVLFVISLARELVYIQFVIHFDPGRSRVIEEEGGFNSGAALLEEPSASLRSGQQHLALQLQLLAKFGGRLRRIQYL